eukprot:CAMPEP_0198248316 /NCGR_PEP_ID=MMETSP1447-20131203/76_1 /TAXON_ID=420782 /ORGANISM="Chaetoceros dichaeta, Strain CCMP1751" /LENGTH=46 /DNA_ID= /DNA_START= /DNA_END= /DNA_ORIENTATION=
MKSIIAFQLALVGSACAFTSQTYSSRSTALQGNVDPLDPSIGVTAP